VSSKMEWCEHGQIGTECEDCNSGVLTLEENEGGTDYILDPEARSVWITVDNLSVYIVRTDEGVSVDLYPKGREGDTSIASTWALRQEAATEEELASGMSIDAPSS